MKRFKFQLETLLKVTRIKKDKAEVKFAECTQRLEDQKRHLTILMDEMQQGHKDYEGLTKKKNITVGTLMTFNSFFAWKREQIEMQQQMILQSISDRQKALQELLDIMNKLKSIEQLKEKKLQQYNEETLQEESKMLDEIGLQLNSRRKRTGDIP